MSGEADNIVQISDTLHWIGEIGQEKEIRTEVLVPPGSMRAALLLVCSKLQIAFVYVLSLTVPTKHLNKSCIAGLLRMKVSGRMGQSYHGMRHESTNHTRSLQTTFKRDLSFL